MEAGCATRRTLIRVFPSILSPAFIGPDFLATTGRSATSQPIDSAFPFGLYLPYLAAFAVWRLRGFPRSSSHSVPSILTLITSMSLAGHIPFRVFLQDMPSHRFPRFLGGSPNTAATSGLRIVPGWTLPAGPSDSPHGGHPASPSPVGGRTSASATALQKGKVTGWI